MMPQGRYILGHFLVFTVVRINAIYMYMCVLGWQINFILNALAQCHYVLIYSKSSINYYVFFLFSLCSIVIMYEMIGYV